MNLTLLSVFGIVLFAVLQYLDAWTTKVGLTSPNGRERNPLMEHWFNQYGVVPTLFATKIATVAIWIVILVFCHLLLRKYSDYVLGGHIFWAAHFILGVFILLYVWQVSENFKVLNRLNPPN